MQELTSIERMTRTLELKPVDHIAAAVTPWKETIKRWREEGHIGPEEDVHEHFGMDIRQGGWLNSTADLDFTEVILEETDETKLVLDGNGAKLRWHKLHERTPEHVDFTVKDRAGWEAFTKMHLVKFDRRRIPFEDYCKARDLAAEKQRFFCWHGVGPFEQMHALCGHVHMLMGMADDPEWVKDMVMTYANLTIMHLETLFAEEGRPQGMFFYEDLGLKGRPFMSPKMYREILQPGHKLLFDFAHSKGCKVLVHSCGFVEPLVLGMVEAGLDCLQAMEVKAGMDMVRLFEMFGQEISFFGNIDARVLIANDRERIEEELQKKIPPILEGGGGYILHSDHSEPPEVDYETMKFFIRRGREIGTPKS